MKNLRSSVADTPWRSKNAHRLCLLVIYGVIILLNPTAECQAVPGDEYWSDEFNLPGLSSIARTFVVYEGDVIVGGDFTHVEQMRVDRIARYDGEHWSPMGDGFDSIVMDAIVHDGELIVCGFFNESGGSPLNHVARWNGTSWEPMGAGLPQGNEFLIIYDGELYCESYRWNGSNWSEAFDVAGFINAMLVYDGRLVVSGSITSAGGIGVQNIFTWDGQQVEARYQGEEERITNLGTIDNQLFMTTSHYGHITTPSTVKYWSGDHWQLAGDLAIHNDFNRCALAVYQDDLVLFTGDNNGDGVTDNLVMSTWDGSGWNYLDSFPGDFPQGLLEYENGLLIGGFVSQHESVVSPNMLYWEPGVPHHLFSHGEGLSGGSARVTSLAPGPDGLVVGGRFENAGQTISKSTALWNGDAWEDWGLQDTEFGWPTACFWSSGQFRSVAYPVNDLLHNYLLWRENDTWHSGAECLAIDQFFDWNGLSLAADADIYHTPDPHVFVEFADLMGGDAECLGEWYNMLIVGGDFTWVEGVYADGIALYDGSAWIDLGGGIDGTVLAVTQFDELLVAGGGFAQAGGTTAANIAAWDGQTWQAMGAGFDGVVRCLAVFNGHLFAGGSFELSGDTEVNHIARWDGVQWQPLGSGVDDYFTEMAVYDGRLFIGGSFEFAGGKPAHHICSWNDPTVTAVPLDETLPTPSTQIVLNAPAPNPFNPVTTLSFELDRPCHVKLEIYDLAGRLVKQLLVGQQAAGNHQIQWLGRNTAGQQMPSGSYLVRLSADDFIQTKNVMLVR